MAEQIVRVLFYLWTMFHIAMSAATKPKTGPITSGNDFKWYNPLQRSVLSRLGNAAEDCVEEGVFPYPEDCTKYYQCVFAFGQFYYFLWDCNGVELEGHWDVEHESCVHGPCPGLTAPDETTDGTTPTMTASTSTQAPPTTTQSGTDPRCPVNCEYRAVDCECSVFFQCRDGVYSEYFCPSGLHFNEWTRQCDLPEFAGCRLDPDQCCKCTYEATGSCSADYIFQDQNRNVTYEGAHHCIREQRYCHNGLVWNIAANNASGACDFPANVEGC